ncbi:MAG: 8-oxo-dGTP diphosphatase [Patescibacteria group bacterium]
MSIPKLLTLCIIQQNDKVLLGLKKRGFGVGRWNGFGGKVNKDESIEQAAIRELDEEVGLHPLVLSKVGVMEFDFVDNPGIMEAHIFKITKFSGLPQESEEMKPQWFDVNKIPYSEMWSSDIYWLPLLLADKKFKGEFLFDRASDAEYSAKIISHKINEVEEL